MGPYVTTYTNNNRGPALLQGQSLCFPDHSVSHLVYTDHIVKSEANRLEVYNSVRGHRYECKGAVVLSAAGAAAAVPRQCQHRICSAAVLLCTQTASHPKEQLVD